MCPSEQSLFVKVLEYPSAWSAEEMVFVPFVVRAKYPTVWVVGFPRLSFAATVKVW